MSLQQLLVLRRSDTAKLPLKSDGSAGYDLFADEEITIEPGEIGKVSTGLTIEPPHDCVIQVWDKSSIAYNEEYRLSTRGGVGDPNYQGTYYIVFRNDNVMPVTIKKGQKIAQILVIKFENLPIVVTDSIESFRNSYRGEGGFGSTGNGLE